MLVSLPYQLKCQVLRGNFSDHSLMVDFSLVTELGKSNENLNASLPLAGQRHLRTPLYSTEKGAEWKGKQ